MIKCGNVRKKCETIPGDTTCQIGSDFTPIDQTTVIEYITNELTEINRDVLQLISVRRQIVQDILN